MINLLEEFVQKTISAFEEKKQVADMWKAPLMAAIPADHPKIALLKQMVSKDHLLPKDLLLEAKSVIVLFIPFADRIPESNIQGRAASELWADAYLLTNELLDHLTRELAVELRKRGHKAETINATNNFDETTLMSRWSHRHFAWIAGLGTFGINNMLITRNGCCGRFTSLVTDASCQELDFSNNEEESHNTLLISEKCLNKRNLSCGLCLKRCPDGVYSKEGIYDRFKCFEVCRRNAELYKSKGLVDVCGKCLVGLPCSIKEPE